MNEYAVGFQLESSAVPKEVLDHLDSRGLRPLNSQETGLMAEHFSRGLTDGLEHQPDGLPMINTGLPVMGFESLRPGQEAVVLVLGGTHNRFAVVHIGDDKRSAIQKYHETDIQQREFTKPSAFYDAMLEPFAPFLKDQNPQAAAVIFAFNSNVTTDHGLDMISMEPLGKGFAVAGISKTRVGEVLFQRPAMSGLGGVDKKIVINDMAPVLIAGEAKVGAIIATGFNIGLGINDFYYVTECGGHFKGMPTHYYADLIDSQSNNPGHGLLEKQLAAGYFGSTFNFATKDLIDAGHIQIPGDMEFTSEDVTAILNPETDLLRGVNAETRAILVNLAARIVYRSAQGTGTLLGAAIRTFPQEFTGEVVRVSVHSPLIGATRNFPAIMSGYASHYSNKNIQLVTIPDADILGAAVAALNQK